MANTAQATSNAVGWFEIPVIDMQRAMKFYEAVLGVKLEFHKMPELDMAWFPMSDGKGASGSLVQNKEWYRPAKDPREGVLIYFMSPSGDLSNELPLIEKAGGRVVIPRKPIGEHGFIAIFLDSEGNRVALHSMK